MSRQVPKLVQLLAVIAPTPLHAAAVLSSALLLGVGSRK